MIRHGWELGDDEIAFRYSQEARLRQYDLNPVHSLIERALRYVQSQQQLSRQGVNLVDIGCGTGVLLERLRRIFPGWDLRGYDPGIPENIEEQPRDRNPLLRYGSIYGLLAESASVDVVILSEVVEHLNRPKQGLDEVRRILKPDGVAIISMPNGSAFPGWKLWARLLPFEWATKRLLPAEHPNRTWQPIDTLYEYDEILELMTACELEILRIETAQYLPPLLHSAPFFGRIYRKFDVDRLARKVLKHRSAYRLVLVTQKRTSLQPD